MTELHWILQHFYSVVCFSLLLAKTSGNSNQENTAYQPAEIKAPIGQPVNLLCQFNHTTKNGDQLFGKFYKSKDGMTIDLNGTASIKCGPSVLQKAFFLCKLSQEISQIKIEDEAVYRCEIIILKYGGQKVFRGTGTKLSLYAEPSVKIQQPPLLQSGRPTDLLCRASGFYPPNVSVLWIHRDFHVHPSSISIDIHRDSTGTFSLQSQYKFNPGVEDHKTQCFCLVSHPDWPVEKTSNITLNISYGPSSVEVTTSATMTNGSVWVELGSSMTFGCTADGNPKPEAKWLWGNFSEVHRGEELWLPNVQKKNEGLYFCVVWNQYGEKNTSVHLLVSENKQTGWLDTLYIVAGVLIAVVLTVSISAVWMMKKMTQGFGGTACCPYSQAPASEELVMTEAVHTRPDMRTKRQQEQKAVFEESQLLYAEIMLPAPSRNTKKMNDMSIYSVVGTKRQKYPEDQEHHNAEVQSIYILAGSPLHDPS